MQRDLNWLNSKWWYRLLKVAYVIAFLVLAVAILNSIIDDLAPYETTDHSTSRLVCTEGNQRNFTYHEVSGTFYVPRFVEGSLDPEGVAQLCGMSRSDYGLNELESDGLRESLGKSLEWKGKVKNAYHLDRKTKIEGSWWYVAGAFVGSLLFFALCFEIVRRIFYYVILGTFRPKKNSHEQE